jgi:hypothetical protein
MSTALRSVGLLDVLSSTPAGPSVARLVSMPVCAASANEKNPTGSGLVDCHMFRMRDGKVDLIQSIVGPTAASMGWPLEPIE